MTGVKPDLSVKLGPLALKNPVMTASGSASVAANDLTLIAYGASIGQPGIFSGAWPSPGWPG